MTIGTYGFAFNYFPYDMGMYVVIAIIGILFNSTSFNYTPNKIWWAVLIYTLLVNLINSFNIPNFVFSLATTILMVFYLGKNPKNNLSLLLNCFCIASLSLSVIYLLNFDKFLKTYDAVNNMERSGWTDPNYLSCIIGMGVVTALYLLLSARKSSVYAKLFWTATLAISFISQVLLASRGGILAVSLPCAILVFMTKTKVQYKILIIIGLIIFLIWLYQNSYFELLSYRMEHDEGGGSGRTDIWINKLIDYSHLNPFEQLFGVGYERSIAMGGSASGTAFHNDYIAVLCQYGVTGFLGFLYFLISPFLKASKSRKIPVSAFIIYIVVACLTLEPFTAGRLTYFGFYLMIIVLVNSIKSIRTQTI